MNIHKLTFIASKVLTRNNYLSVRNGLNGSAGWTEAEIDQYQNKAIVKIIQFAYEKIPYYKNRWKYLSINQERIKNISDLCVLPILTKLEINKNLSEMLNPAEATQKIAGSTGGSTGIPMRYFMSPQNALYSSVLLDRGLGLGGYSPGDRLAIIAGGSLVGPHKTIHKRLIERLTNVRYFSSYGMSEETLQKYATELIKFQPKFIRGYASALNVIASYMKDTGLNNRIKIHAIFSTSEMLTDNVRANIENIFRCKVFDGWGLNDGGASAFECKEHNGMHIDPERAFVEIVEDEFTDIYGPGVGKVVVTNLIDTVMPFIRYDTGDIGRIETTRCSCGLFTPRIYINFGRITDCIKVGNKIIGAPVLTVLMGSLPVKQYQIAKTGFNELSFRIVRGDEYSEDTELFLRRSLYERVGNLDLIFNYVREIIPPGGMKHKFLINEYDAFNS